MRHDKIHSPHQGIASERKSSTAGRSSANDNAEELAAVDGDPLILLLAKMDIAATRLW